MPTLSGIGLSTPESFYNSLKHFKITKAENRFVVRYSGPIEVEETSPEKVNNKNNKNEGRKKNRKVNFSCILDINLDFG